jgi:ATP-dependent helicase HrpA
VELEYGGIPIRRYPTLVDHGESVSLRLVESKSQAERQLRRGLRRLFAIAEERELRMQVAWLPRLNEIRLFATGLPGGGLIDGHIADLLAERAFLAEQASPRTAEQFAARQETGRENIGLAVQDVTVLLYSILSAYHEARCTLEEQKSSRSNYAIEDVHEQLSELIQPGFLTDTPWQWLQQYPRYFRAIVYRFERLQSGSLDRDQRSYEELKPYLSAYRRLKAEQVEFGIDDEELPLLRWMLEEWRVSLFAQPLGTSMPVSAKRVERQLAKVHDPSGVAAEE